MPVDGPMVKRPSVAGGFKRSATETRDITVRFDAETFEAVRLKAVAQNVSFGEMVRKYVDWGLEQDDE